MSISFIDEGEYREALVEEARREVALLESALLDEREDDE